jgi:membrane protein DedA with SNARE-associated domain
MVLPNARSQQNLVMVQAGASLVVLVAAAMLAAQQSDQGWFYWVCVVVAVVNLGEVIYFAAKYLRPRRAAERIN